jgi:Flp pilus assembly pilin Flp
VWDDRRGAVAVEYLMLVVFIGLPLALMVASLTPRIKNHYANQRAVLARPVP